MLNKPSCGDQDMVGFGDPGECTQWDELIIVGLGLLPRANPPLPRIWERRPRGSSRACPSRTPAALSRAGAGPVSGRQAANKFAVPSNMRLQCPVLVLPAAPYNAPGSWGGGGDLPGNFMPLPAAYTLGRAV